MCAKQLSSLHLLSCAMLTARGIVLQVVRSAVVCASRGTALARAWSVQVQRQHMRSVQVLSPHLTTPHMSLRRS